MKLNRMASCREFLEQMPTQELDEMLQAELQKEPLDENLIRLILDVLEFREMGYPVKYNSDIIETSKKLEEIRSYAPRKIKYPQVLKVASILLVVSLLLFALPQVAHAENIFDLLARWTDSVFEFFNPSSPNDQPEYVFKTDNPGLREIYDATEEMGITEPVVPMWIPDGYKLEQLEKKQLYEDGSLNANLIKGENYIFLSYVINEHHAMYVHEKDEKCVDTLEINGITHYVFLDKEKYLVTWFVDNLECVIYADCQEEDFYAMLYSIYALEE